MLLPEYILMRYVFSPGHLWCAIILVPVLLRHQFTGDLSENNEMVLLVQPLNLFFFTVIFFFSYLLWWATESLVQVSDKLCNLDNSQHIASLKSSVSFFVVTWLFFVVTLSPVLYGRRRLFSPAYNTFHSYALLVLLVYCLSPSCQLGKKWQLLWLCGLFRFKYSWVVRVTTEQSWWSISCNPSLYRNNFEGLFTSHFLDSDFFERWKNLMSSSSFASLLACCKNYYFFEEHLWFL